MRIFRVEFVIKSFAMLSLLSATGLVISCGKKSTTSAATASTLEGTWISGCVLDSAATQSSAATYSKTTVVFTGSNETTAVSVYSDTPCSTATGAWINATATFVLGAGATAVAGAQTVDTTTVSISVTPKDDGTAAGFNAASYCGATDWKIGTAKDISTCKDPTTGKAAAGTTTFDIVAITNSTFTEGLTTADLDGSTAAKRPTALDPKTVYSKQ